MKNLFRYVTCAGLLAGTVLGAAQAHAGNAAVENALRSRPELSSFYEALVNTGVLNELSPAQSYTIFAPTNDALDRISEAQYPCFYSAQCAPEVADIMRNHIVPGQVYVSDIINRQGVVFSIDRHSIAIAEPYQNQYTADGQPILSQTQTAGGILYRLDGMIASPQEMAALWVPATQVQSGTQVTDRVYYSPSGRVDGKTEMIVTTTPVYPVIAPAPAPAYTVYTPAR